MPIALNISREPSGCALALYTHLLYRDALGKPAMGIGLRPSAALRVNVPKKDLYGIDTFATLSTGLYAQDAWRELVDAGLALETPDKWGRYSAYTYAGGSKS